RFVLFTIGAIIEFGRVVYNNSEIPPESDFHTFFEEGSTISMMSAYWILCLFHSISLLYLQSTFKKLKLLIEVNGYVEYWLNNPESVVQEGFNQYDSDPTRVLHSSMKREGVLQICISTFDTHVTQKILNGEKYMCMGVKVQSFGLIYFTLLPIMHVLLIFSPVLMLSGELEDFKRSYLSTVDWLSLIHASLIQLCLAFALHDYTKRTIGSCNKLALILLVSLIIHKSFFYVIPAIKSWDFFSMLYRAVLYFSSIRYAELEKTVRDSGLEHSYIRDANRFMAGVGIWMDLEVFVLVATIHCFYTFLCLAMTSRATKARGTVRNLANNV
ncbi:hypothetical protein PFISCL1PPCAC_2321, partial [Pristionchus fissidentatus]